MTLNSLSLAFLCSLIRWRDIYTALECADSVLAAEGVRDTMGLVNWGMGPRATMSCTFSEALCRRPMACWWLTV